MNLVVLYTRLSGYLSACLEAYRAETGGNFLIFAWPPEQNAPFTDGGFCELGEVLDRSKLGQEQIEERVRAFQPDAILVSGWLDPAYNRINRKLKAEGVPIIAGCDTQWTGSLRQRAASLVAPWHVRQFISVLWVTGQRQRQLAYNLGFRGPNCWEGFYACDWERFARQKPPVPATQPRCFLFVGRYVEEKGIRDLAAAYHIYRTKVENAWPLVCAGKGELAPVLVESGAEDRGFVQPERLPELMRGASTFVLPSLFEPWGVVVHEAAACSLPLIVSKACGASVHLVRDGYNGYVTNPGDSEHLAWAMIRAHKLTEVERQEFGRRSFELSKQYTPKRWSRTLTDGLAMLVPDLADKRLVRQAGWRINHGGGVGQQTVDH